MNLHDITDAIAILCLSVIFSAIALYMFSQWYNLLLSPVWMFLAIAALLFMVLEEKE
jgi:hypothetical protein